ncbi:unnamed protein product [Brachionus calyciflorus]|uniref:Uncharacterized protein n=1 Tax=Brachionus calyciflorus TaxID=104777 RepID=A0A813TV78_9BILA|nr:unnamed protein product [Brachionus calyciflorus]
MGCRASRAKRQCARPVNQCQPQCSTSPFGYGSQGFGQMYGGYGGFSPMGQSGFGGYSGYPGAYGASQYPSNYRMC